jgi:hypothetical protein
MTETEPSTAAPSKRSPAIVAAIVIVIVIALAGGAFVVYKLTKSKDQPVAYPVVAHKVLDAVKAGDTATIRSNSTGQGTAQLLAFKRNSLDGFKLVVTDCKPFQAKTPTRVCTVTRPGGQLGLRLIFTSGAWRVDLATVGPAGLPPKTTPTT